MTNPSGMENGAPLARRTSFPVWLWAAGVISILGAAGLAARLVWEQTVWTWQRGPQMIGFSLAHGNYGMLLLFGPLLFLWLLTAGIVSVVKAVKRRFSATAWLGLAPALLTLLVLALPYAFWQRVFVARLANSTQAATDLTFAAVEGELGVVKALISHGVPVNAADYEGRTALHDAAFAGDLPELRYLVSRGANLNALDDYGDSPLELADSEGHQKAAQYLAAHGARRVRGTDEQRQRAIERHVAQAVERQDKQSKDGDRKP
jgi:hypothetical protein